MVVTAKAPGADFASVPPVASYPDPITVDRNERNLEFESKEAESASHDGGILLAASQDTEAQGSTPPEVPCDPEQIRKEQAATKAQAAFRGYLVIFYLKLYFPPFPHPPSLYNGSLFILVKV